MTVVVPSRSEGVRYDTSPLGLKKNWVTEHGGLPDFVRAVAHALQRNGHSESQAIQMAIGTIKRWAAGGGHVTAKTRAKAAETVAHWEAMKASTGRSDEELMFRASGAFAAGHPFEGNQYMSGPNATAPPGDVQQGLGLNGAQAYLFAVNYQQATGQKVTGQLTNGQLAAAKTAIGAAVVKAMAAGGGGGKAAAGKAAAALKAAQAKAAAQAAHQAALDRAAAQPVSSGSVASAHLTNSLSAADRQTMVKGVPPAGFTWSGPQNNPTLIPATPLGKATMDSLVAKNPGLAGQGTATGPVPTAGTPATTAAKAGVTAAAAAQGAPATKASQRQANAINTLPPADRAKASKGTPPAGFTWAQDAKGGWSLVASHRAMAEFSSDGPGPRTTIHDTDPSGAGALLPVTDRKTPRIHRFAGSDLGACSECGKPIGDERHSRKFGLRWDPTVAAVDTDLVPPHNPLPSTAADLSAAAKVTNAADQDRIEGLMAKIVTKHFADQRQSVLSRLKGKRGAQMIRRAATPPEFPNGGDTPEHAAVAPDAIVGASPAAVDPQAVFDDAFWTAQLATALEPAYAAAGATAVGRAAQQAGIPMEVADQDSLQAVDKVLTKRAHTAAIQVTETTRKAIFGAIQQGMAEGEGQTELAARINAIFDNADSVRARTIAQTEGVGALNAALQHYAEHLPDDTVGGKMWLAHHDDRTRPTHRLADGQIVPVDKPFWVGGIPMMQPGDHDAPPSETINCRCSLALVPHGVAQPILGKSDLEGLIPSTSLANLDAILSKQEANRQTAEAAAAAAPTVNA